MRLWHIDLISKLPSCKDYKGCSNQLGGQHVEIRMILGSIAKHGEVNHSTVNYVNYHPLYYLKAYGLVVMQEMRKRGFNISQDIFREYYNDIDAYDMFMQYRDGGIKIIYPEHDNNYLEECLVNLKGKGIVI
jgi:uncharacterized protein (TIGR02328 family)